MKRVMSHELPTMIHMDHMKFEFTLVLQNITKLKSKTARLEALSHRHTISATGYYRKGISTEMADITANRPGYPPLETFGAYRWFQTRTGLHFRHFQAVSLHRRL